MQILLITKSQQRQQALGGGWLQVVSAVSPLQQPIINLRGLSVIKGKRSKRTLAFHLATPLIGAKY